MCASSRWAPHPGPSSSLLTLGATVHRLEVTGGDGVVATSCSGTRAPRTTSTRPPTSAARSVATPTASPAAASPSTGSRVAVGAHDRGNSLHGGPDGFDRREWRWSRSRTPPWARAGQSGRRPGLPGTLRTRVRFRSADAVRVASRRPRTPPRCQPDQPRLLQPRRGGRGHGRRPPAQVRRRAVHARRCARASRWASTSRSPARRSTCGRPTRVGTAVRGARAAGRCPGHRPQLRPRRAGGRAARGRRARVPAHPHADEPATPTSRGCRSTRATSSTARRSTGGVRYRQGDGIALEPQLFPDSPHHPSGPRRGWSRGDATARPRLGARSGARDAGRGPRRQSEAASRAARDDAVESARPAFQPRTASGLQPLRPVTSRCVRPCHRRRVTRTPARVEEGRRG